MENTQATRRLDRLARGAFLLGISFVAALVFAEILVRVLPIPALSRAKVDALELDKANWRVQPHPYLAYSPKPNFHTPVEQRERVDYRHNSLGFHGPEITLEKPAGTYRILCLGGSSTYCQTESTTEAGWPRRLEVLLDQEGLGFDVEVVNGGCQGYSTFESLSNLCFRGLDLDPDLVLVYHAINDMRCALYPGAVGDNTHWRVNWPVERVDGIESLFERSYLYRVVRRYNTGWYKRRSNLGSYAIRDYGKYFANGGDDYLQPTSAKGFDNFQRNLTSIVSVARAHGADVVFVTQAMWLDHIRGAQSFELQKKGLEKIRELTFSVAKEREVALIDAAPEIEAAAQAELEAHRAAAKSDKERAQATQSLIAHEVHFSDAGSDLLAHVLARELVARQLLRKSSSH